MKVPLTLVRAKNINLNSLVTVFFRKEARERIESIINILKREKITDIKTISNETGIPRSTTFDLLKRLENLGFVDTSLDKNKYELSNRFNRQFEEFAEFWRKYKN